jgi:hypothetical protein
MLSHKLVEKIECHCEVILAGVIVQVRQDPVLKHMGTDPQWELQKSREWSANCTHVGGHRK